MTDSSWRYGNSGAAAYAARSAGRARSEAILLDALLAGLDLGLTLDVPCGTGRLRPLLARHGATWIGADAAAAMLERVRGSDGRVLRARVEALPFADGAFDTVVCFRLLHHVPPPLQRDLVTELARVARRYVVLSGFHPFSLHGLQRRLAARLRGRTPGRHGTRPRDADAWLAPMTALRARRQGWFRELWAGVWAATNCRTA